ncbi:hypothetical protein ZWY2020_035510 [Hordeum vulgare]|nr:hypothetical protein ZWY2020_035510 [Hordeum vulgare]
MKRLAMAWREDKLWWQSELEHGEMEARRLRDELVAASEHLANLTTELFARAVEGACPDDEKHAGSAGQGEEGARGGEGKRGEGQGRCQLSCSLSLRLCARTRRRRKQNWPRYAESRARHRRRPPVVRGGAELAAAHSRARDSGEEKKKTTPEQLDEARREAERAKASARATQEEDARLARAAVQAKKALLEVVMRGMLWRTRCCSNRTQLGTRTAKATPSLKTVWH